MKLLVCTNFAQPFHTGGAERVVQQITESLTQEHKWECSVLCQFGTKPIVHNGVQVIPIGNAPEKTFLDTVEAINPDHIFVYSDWYSHWETLLKNAEKLRAKKSIGLVGMNRMRSPLTANASIAQSFRSKHHLFKVLAHADKYIDAQTCREWGIPVSIIHNAIDLEEFSPPTLDFRKVYNIKTKKMLLCVANFFHGKGQEYLLPIMKRLSDQDVTLVFICSTLAFRPGNLRMKQISEQITRMNLPIRILQDIPRSHVISAYFASDAFVFPSQTECGPIVVLESMAAGKPWVALNVGHIPELKGGICVHSVPGRGEYLAFDDRVSTEFESATRKLLSDSTLSEQMGFEGRAQIGQEYNWSIISRQYKEFFESA